MAMNPPPAPRVYKDYEPGTEWELETLIVHLPGYRTEKLRVQVTSDGKLRVSGEHHIEENKWERFSMELPIPSNCDPDRIKAMYEDGKLRIEHPKKENPKTSSIREPDQRPATEAQQKKNSEQTDEKSSRAETGGKSGGEETPPENADKNKEKHGEGMTRIKSYKKVAGNLVREMKKRTNLANLVLIVLLALFLSLSFLQKQRPPLEMSSED